MKRVGTWGLVAAVTGALAAAGHAQERFVLDGGAQGPVELRADTLGAGEGGARLEATGGVVIRWGGYRLTADRVSLARSEGVARASGGVSLEDEDGNVLRAQALELELATQVGEVTGGELWIAREGYRVWGERFRRTGPRTYEVERGGFTACDGTWPSWRVEARHLAVEVEGYLRARGAAFWVEGVPVVYTPFLVYPVKRQRQSGFLIPKVGYTDRDGFLSVLRYYWAPWDAADLTARMEYRSRRGWTEGAEVRYSLAEGHGGAVGGTHSRDRRDGQHRYRVQARHDSRFEGGYGVAARLDYLGDADYLKDTGDTLDDRGVDRLQSYLLATHDGDRGTAFGLVDFLQTLQARQGETLQTLPAAGFRGREVPLGAGLLGSLDGAIHRFWREEGVRGERLALDPVLAWEPAPGLAARGGYRQHLYRVGDDTLGRGAAHAEATAAMALARSWGGWLHTVEPGARVYWGEAGRGPEPPRFDPGDAFEERAGIAVAVEQRALRRSDLGELGALTAERAYDLVGGVWLPWRVEARFAPHRAVSARAEAEVDPSRPDPWRRWAAEGEVRDDRGDRLFGAYRFVAGEASYADGGLGLALTRELGLEYRRRHSVRDRRTLEETVGLRLEHPCWELLVTYSRNYRAEAEGDERRYLAVLSLRGLGRVGTLRGLVP